MIEGSPARGCGRLWYGAKYVAHTLIRCIVHLAHSKWKAYIAPQGHQAFPICSCVTSICSILGSSKL